MKKNILKSMSIIMSILLLMPFLESNCFFCTSQMHQVIMKNQMKLFVQIST